MWWFILSVWTICQLVSQNISINSWKNSFNGFNLGLIYLQVIYYLYLEL